MTILAFIAAIVKAVAWPIVVLIGIILFRRQFMERIGSINKLSHGKTEVLFDQQAREVEAVIASSDPLPAAMEPSAPNLISNLNVGKIVLAWNELESSLLTSISKSDDKSENLSGARLLEHAHRDNVITADQYRALSGLRAMRNLAVHAPGGKIDDTRIEEFLVLADAMAAVMKITKP